MPHILIIEAPFYTNITTALAEGAIHRLKAEKATYERISVPGAFEIPAALSIAIASGKFDGYITLGCVIRGETSHYDYVCGESARGINDLAIQHKAAIGYGILTCENTIQAERRANPNGEKNVGGRAADACLSMLKLQQKLSFKQTVKSRARVIA